MLDAEGIASVRRAIDRIVEKLGPAVVLVEHRIDENAGADGVAGLPPRAIVLDSEGGLLADGPTAMVLEQSARQLVAAGCWTPLETEPQAAFGTDGGLGSPTIRGELLGWTDGHLAVPDPPPVMWSSPPSAPR